VAQGTIVRIGPDRHATDNDESVQEARQEVNDQGGKIDKKAQNLMQFEWCRP